MNSMCEFLTDYLAGIIAPVSLQECDPTAYRTKSSRFSTVATISEGFSVVQMKIG